MYGQKEGKPETAADRPSDTAESGKTATDTAIIAISAKELLKFFESPCKHYYEKIVGIDLNIRETEQPDDDEPSELDNLQQYHIQNGIYEAYKKGIPCKKNEFHLRKQAEGSLPFGAAGGKILDVLWDETNEWIAEVDKAEAEAGESLDSIKDFMEMDIDGVKVRLSYELGDLRRNYQYIARPADVKAKDSHYLDTPHEIPRIEKKWAHRTLREERLPRA